MNLTWQRCALLGTLGLSVVLAIATVVLFFKRRGRARYSLLALLVLMSGYAGAMALFSYTSYDCTARRGDEKFFCGMDCHIAYSVQNVERAKSISSTTAEVEFLIVTIRSHFDERTIAPWRGNGALRADPPRFELVSADARRVGCVSFSIPLRG